MINNDIDYKYTEMKREKQLMCIRNSDLLLMKLETYEIQRNAY